ncbi:MAG TPA: MMPL family transporter [Kribbella sp.]
MAAQPWASTSAARSRADLAVPESITIPLILVLLLLAFGSMVAALLPLIIGAISMFGTFAELAILGSITYVSVYAVTSSSAGSRRYTTPVRTRSPRSSKPCRTRAGS